VNVTLEQEQRSYALCVGDRKVAHVREDGKLGPIRKLVDEQSRELYVVVESAGLSGAFGSVFNDIFNLPRQVSIAACSPSLLSELLKAGASIPAEPELSQLSIEQAAFALIERADKEGYVLTVHQQPKQPLAMGNFETVVELRPRRGAAA
jgi:hypothetical protein